MKYLFVLLILGTHSAWAIPSVSELGNQLKSNLSQFEDQLSCREWDENYLHLTIGASAAIGIPDILEVQVVPQLTLIWTKNN